METGIDMSTLNTKSVAELEALGVKMTAIKEEFLRDWEKAAKIIQDKLVEAKAREYAIRNSDPKYAAKLQGQTPDFVRARQAQLDALLADRMKTKDK